MGSVAAILLGLVLLGASWVCWTGRWRGWARIAVMPWMPITMLPGLGACLALAGVGGLLSGVAQGLCYGLAFALLFAGIVLGLWGPDWYGPRWFRERDREYDLSVPLNAAVAATVRTDPGAAASEARAREAMGGREPDARWRAHLVSDAHGHPSAMQRLGVVRGHLLIYPDALVFAADVREDRMRGRPVTAVIPAASIRAVQRVPAGSRPEGAESGSDLPSRVRPRLRVDAADGPHYFEITGAARRARELEERFLGRAGAVPAAG
jgi:hypothetical protein